MTNQELLDLQPGDIIAELCNGRTRVVVLTDVRKATQCINETSGAHGHWARGVEWASGTGNGWITTSINSDEYNDGLGYPSHDALGKRQRGWWIERKGTEIERQAAVASSSLASKPAAKPSAERDVFGRIEKVTK